MIRLFSIAGGVLILDQLTKWYALHAFQTPWVFTPWFEFTYAENRGIAFSIPITGPFLTILTIFLIIAGSIYTKKHLPLHKTTLHLPLGLLLGGALGNLLDRALRGFVIDFISVGWWPIFNIADTAICIGGILLCALLIKEKPTRHESAQKE